MSLQELLKAHQQLTLQLIITKIIHSQQACIKKYQSVIKKKAATVHSYMKNISMESMRSEAIIGHYGNSKRIKR